MENIVNRYLGHVEAFNKINTHYFLRHIESRLPGLRDHFEQAEGATGVDWHLLAAMGYQESHWQSDATSQTGVRGLMMLTRATATQLGVKNRLDADKALLEARVIWPP